MHGSAVPETFDLSPLIAEARGLIKSSKGAYFLLYLVMIIVDGVIGTAISSGLIAASSLCSEIAIIRDMVNV